MVRLNIITDHRISNKAFKIFHKNNVFCVTKSLYLQDLIKPKNVGWKTLF